MTDAQNVILLTSHDIGTTLGAYGHETVDTPNIDTLADQGTRFDNCFTTSPQCAPSRGSLATGCYPQTNGLMGLPQDPWAWSYDEDAVRLSSLFNQSGHETSLFGIQHETTDAALLPFDDVSHATESFKRGQDGPTPAADVGQTVSEYLQTADNQFYMEVNFFEAHRPFDFGSVQPDTSRGVHVPPQFEATGELKDDLAQFQGAIRELDRAIGDILDTLESTGLRENTIVAFTADHGISFSRAKGYLYDSGIAVPFILSLPPGQDHSIESTDAMISSIDIMPTLLDLGGVEVPPHIDGKSFASTVKRGDRTPERDAIFAMYHDHYAWGFGPHARCIRTEDHKLIQNLSADRKFETPIRTDEMNYRLGRDSVKSSPRAEYEFYDLRSDPNEFKNLRDTDAEDGANTLKQELTRWLDALDDPVRREIPLSPGFNH